jgi:hypothetical protein
LRYKYKIIAFVIVLLLLFVNQLASVSGLEKELEEVENELEVMRNTLKEAYPDEFNGINFQVLGVMTFPEEKEYPSRFPYDKHIEWIIDEINKCENFGRWDNNVILDTNNKYSYGGLQFQMTTFVGQGIYYGVLPRDTSFSKAKEIIFTEEIQREIARGMIRDKKAHTTLGWFNCWRKQRLYY